MSRDSRAELAIRTVVAVTSAGAGLADDDAFLAFIERALSSAERQQLLARVLLVPQDTAIRDKRLGLARALAAAVTDTGTRVDEELIFIRILDDLDPFHIRLLRLMQGTPPHLAAMGYTTRAWTPGSLSEADPGLADTLASLLSTLQRHGLTAESRIKASTPYRSMEPEFIVTRYGELFSPG